MAETTGLTNSRRRFDKVSYTPVHTAPPPTTTDAANGNGYSATAGLGVFNLAALVRTLKISQQELQHLAYQAASTKHVTEAIGSLLTAVSGNQTVGAARTLAALPVSDLTEFGHRLGALRNAAAAELTSARADLVDRHSDSATAEHSTQIISADHPPARPAVDRPAPSEAQTPHGTQSADLPSPTLLPNTGGPAVPAPTPMRAADPVPWARAAQPDLLARIQTVVGSVQSLADVDRALADLTRGKLATQLFADSLTQRPLEPIGLLHLERLEMTPLDVQRGELVYSLPLAPHEKVTLAHREWTTREDEYQQYIQDYQENFSQQGVAQSDDIAMATATQSAHSNELSMGSQPTTTTPATLTPAVPSTIVGSTVDDQTSQQTSRNQTRTVTATASARTIKDQKISFTVTTVSGVEDFTAQTFENPHNDYALRIDYYRRMRSWRSDLYRYGVRMTYDVVLPDPGQLLRHRQEQIISIDNQLAQGFSMDLSPSELTAANWQYWGDHYGVTLAAPPEQTKRVEANKVVGYNPPVVTTTGGGINWTLSHFSEELQVPIPTGYDLTRLHVLLQASTWTTGVGAQWITVIADDFVRTFDAGDTGYVIATTDIPVNAQPTDGTVAVAFRLKGIGTGELIVVATATASDATDEQWRQTAWSTLRDKAYADYIANLDRLRNQRAALVSQIDNTDALTLRRLEREQIMRATLSWLFPGFGDASSVLEGLGDPSSLPTATWQKVMQYGQYIRFVQSAIDWDNVLVLLYPYFWDTPENRQEKLLLNHPDPLHRDFLRAGAARVILAIQPGYEDDVVSLLDQGQFGTLGQDTVFAKVARDVRAANAVFAASTAPTSSDPDNARQPGVLIGSWHDFTPTAALDVDLVKLPLHP